MQASERIVERGRRIAARMLEAAPEDVGYKDGRFTVAGTDKGVTFAEVARTAYTPRQLPPGMEPGFSETAGNERPVVEPGASFLAKPFSPQTLLDSIRRAIERT